MPACKTGVSDRLVIWRHRLDRFGRLSRLRTEELEQAFICPPPGLWMIILEFLTEVFANERMAIDSVRTVLIFLSQESRLAECTEGKAPSALICT